jgi:CarboxypepD_reg-like domain
MQGCLRYVLLAALVAFFYAPGYAQRKPVGLSGIVYDAATRAPMPYVSVVNETTQTGTITAENGTFTIGCTPGDSIKFTMVGYYPKKRTVEEDMRSMVVLLSESTLTLSPITVYGAFKPQGFDQWKTTMEMPRVFTNPAGPGSGYNVQTFGAGISLTGLMSRFSKSEKEKRKVAVMREKNRKSEAYNDLVTSEEVKSFFQATFAMSEEEYESFVRRFNAVHPEAAQLQDKEEIKNLMVAFKASNK